MEASGSGSGGSGPPSPPPPPPPPPLPPKTTKRKGILSRIWNRLFGIHGDDFEKRLKHISKEEASVLNRMRKRSHTWAKTAKELIIISVLLWVVALGYAIMTTRSLDLDWKMRAFRVLPMFLCPALSFLAYSALASFVKMLDRRDQKTLERLQAERQAKINELKEKTNYYITQQLIQRYDPDPAAKAAAATVLASKLGADSGLKVFVGEESKLHAPKGKSNDVELMESSGLRNRKQVPPRSSSHGSAEVHHSNEVMAFNDGEGSPVTLEQSQSVTVEHHHDDGSASHDGGWFARIAALLVGEDPTHSYALICGNCHIHNGLARKEDFPYITYYCPHCHALNRAKHTVEGVSDPDSLNVSSNPISTSEVINNDIGSSGESVVASGANIEGEGVTSENTVS